MNWDCVGISFKLHENGWLTLGDDNVILFAFKYTLV